MTKPRYSLKVSLAIRKAQQLARMERSLARCEKELNESVRALTTEEFAQYMEATKGTTANAG